MRKFFTPFALIGLLLVGARAAAQTKEMADDRQVVTVALATQAFLDEPVIYLDQIAKISGGSPALRHRLSRLDIADFRLGAEHVVVTGDQIRFRLLLAGIEPTQFRVTGAKRTIVEESSEPVTTRKILAAATQAMRAKQMSVGVPKEFVAPPIDLHPLDKVRLEAKAPTTTARAGSSQVDVAIIVNGKMRDIIPVTFESVAKAPTSNAIDPGLRPAAALTPAAAKGDILIKARDQVKIVAFVGPVQVVARGEAQQDGKLGDVIRVRNTESNRVINARVETRDAVLAEY